MYRTPEWNCTFEEMEEFVKNMPMSDDPKVFGLHGNADIAYQQRESRFLMNTIVKIQPAVSAVEEVEKKEEKEEESDVVEEVKKENDEEKKKEETKEKETKEKGTEEEVEEGEEKKEKEGEKPKKPPPSIGGARKGPAKSSTEGLI
jgi:dynein heavy chain